MTANETAGGALQQLSDGLAAAVERAAAWTVTVKGRQRVPATGVAWAQGGVVLTADHVLERDEGIVVALPNGREAPARLAGRDPGSDLAVLRVEADGLPAAERAEGARVGHIVLAVGRPLAGPPMASLGVISASGGAWRTFRGGQVDAYLRTDATFFPGFSGGPLVDASGRLVGINSSRLARGSGLTVPWAAAEKIAQALLSQGRLRRGYLGIGSQVARLPAALATRLGRDQETGLLLVSVEPDSPAEKAGLLLGDILVEMAGTPVRDTDDLQGQLGPESVGSAISLTVLRGGQPLSLTVQVGERT